MVSLGVGERYPCESVRHARIAPGAVLHPAMSVSICRFATDWLSKGAIQEVVWLRNRRTAKMTYILLMCLHTIRAITITHRHWSDRPVWGHSILK